MNKSNFRWVICSLLFFATTVNYLDRQVLSLTYKDFIAPVFGWSDNDYGTITAVFSIIYALCNLFAGKFIDRLGTKKAICGRSSSGRLVRASTPDSASSRHTWSRGAA